MNTRRDFLKATVAAAAVGGASGLQAAASRKAPGQGLHVPDGARFEGMAGAYSAMYTPFFREGEKRGPAQRGGNRAPRRVWREDGPDGHVICDMLKFAKSRIAHVHLKDQTAADNHAVASLGLGVVPNERIVEETCAAGYDGWYTLENPVGDTYVDTARQIAVLKAWMSGK